jgi:hypothetical protein
MVHYGNFVNNHLANRFDQNRAAVIARGHQPLPPVSAPPVAKPPIFSIGRLIDVTGHIFGPISPQPQPAQTFDTQHAANQPITFETQRATNIGY